LEIDVMEYISDAIPYARAGWRIASRATAISTVHALYHQADEVICFDVNLSGPVRELVSTVVDPFLIAIEAQMRGNGLSGDSGLLPRSVSGFDMLGYLSGAERRLTRGWSDPGWPDDIRVVHVFPCYACELSAAWPAQRFASIVRDLQVLDIARRPSPYIEMKMRGGKSKLLIKNWSRETLRSTLVYAKILAEEPEAVLEVKNLMGDVLAFNKADGWHAYEDRITAHALRSSIA
jgi:hypothetical protein